MTQETQQTEQQEQVVVTLSLNVTQINFILESLGKMPTDTGAWIVRQIVATQAQSQLGSQQESEEETPTVQ